MNLIQIVSENIKGFRKLRNLTQEALAIKSGLHPNYIARFERGEVGMAFPAFEKIAKTLKVEPNVLLIKDSYKKEK